MIDFMKFAILQHTILWALLTIFFVGVIRLLISFAKVLLRPGPILFHVPTIWTLRSLYESANSVQRGSSVQEGYFVPARPQVYVGSLRHRLRCAWLAFTGRVDLVRWPEGQ